MFTMNSVNNFCHLITCQVIFNFRQLGKTSTMIKWDMWYRNRRVNIGRLLTTSIQQWKESIKKLSQLERIQNERWYLRNTWHIRKTFQKRLNAHTEKRLYHGCPEEADNAIIHDGFNRSYAGVNGALYGFGVYFSSNAAYSHSYAKAKWNGNRSMFVVCVLVGKTTGGNSSMKTRPLGFDSTTDGDHIFVTYHDAQAYGEYLITYKWKRTFSIKYFLIKLSANFFYRLTLTTRER